MSDFKGVMREWTRMCKSYGNTCCTDDGRKCPILSTELCLKAKMKMNEKDYDGIEQIVMTWAAANPEPVYPTWIKWLVENDIMQDIGRGYTYVVTVKGLKPIPTDIAERLGVKPKS